MSASTSTRPVPDLPVAGVIPFSATDWPGLLTATVFTQGCPLSCRYCHNPTLQAFRGGEVSFPGVLEFLDTRRGLLDGLVISGGEPTVHRGLGAAVAATRARGFPVGLHTSGYSPTRLAALLAEPTTRPDWIGLDVKGLPASTPGVVGCTPATARRMWESLDVVTAAGVEVQVRTTVWPGSLLERQLPELRARVRDAGHELVVQYARGVAADGHHRVA